VTPEAIAAVEAIVKEYRRVTVNEIAAHLDMSLDQHTTSSMMLCSSIKSLQGGCHASRLQN
jgi:hypothetical protein